MNKVISIYITCTPKDLDCVISQMLKNGWKKDSNMHSFTQNGHVKFEMWKVLKIKEDEK